MRKYKSKLKTSYLIKRRQRGKVTKRHRKTVYILCSGNRGILLANLLGRKS